MMPGRRNIRPLHAGMAGVRIPGHVGRWDVFMETKVVGPDGKDVVLCGVRSTTLDARMLVTGERQVVYVKIPADWISRLEQKGWKL